MVAPFFRASRRRSSADLGLGGLADFELGAFLHLASEGVALSSISVDEPVIRGSPVIPGADHPPPCTDRSPGEPGECGDLRRAHCSDAFGAREVQRILRRRETDWAGSRSFAARLYARLRDRLSLLL